MPGPSSHEERQLLDEALIRTYAKKGITHNNESLIDPEHPDRYREMPLLGDIYEILMESPETRRMGNILNRLVNGSAKTFNQHTNVQLDNLYTVLDISELTGELLPVGMFVALDYVWDKAKEDRTKEKAIFIDEAWELIGDDDTNNPNNTKALAGEWVQEIFKIIRGYGGAAIAATQDIGDLDRSRFGKGILNVAKTKIILNLENDEAQRVQHILHLSDAEIMSITRFISSLPKKCLPSSSIKPLHSKRGASSISTDGRLHCEWSDVATPAITLRGISCFSVCSA